MLMNQKFKRTEFPATFKDSSKIEEISTIEIDLFIFSK